MFSFIRSLEEIDALKIDFCLFYVSTYNWGPRSLSGKESTCHSGEANSIPGLERSLREGDATHSSILAWEIPQTEEPGGLQSTALQESDTA